MNQSSQQTPQLPPGHVGMNVVIRGAQTSLGIVMKHDDFTRVYQNFITGQLPPMMTHENTPVAPGTARFAIRSSEIVMIFEWGKATDAAVPPALKSLGGLGSLNLHKKGL